MSIIPVEVPEVPVNGNGNHKMRTNAWVQRMVVTALIALAGASVLAVCVLSFMGREVPPSLSALATATVVALASALSPIRQS